MMNEDELMHYGRKGQKWYHHLPDVLDRMNGKKYDRKADKVKKQQDKISSVSGNNKRALDKHAKLVEKEIKLRNKAESYDKKDSNRNEPEKPKTPDYSVKHKPISQMTNEELQAAATRMRLEQDYAKYLQKPETKDNISKGKSMVSEIASSAVKDIGKQAASWVLGTTVNGLAKTLGAKDNIVDPKLIQKKKK